MYNMSLVVFLLLLHLQIGSAAPSSQDLIHSKADEIPVPVMLASTSTPLNSATSEMLASTLIKATSTVHIDTSSVFVTSFTSIPSHTLSALPITLPETTATQKITVESQRTAPPTSIPSSSALPRAQVSMSSSSRPRQATPSYSFFYESTRFITTGISSSSSSSPPSANVSIAPAMRYALIGVLAGVPALIILGFILTCRWRRVRHSRGHTSSKELVDVTARKSARFSSFFGINNGHAAAERKARRQAYATSVHSTAGMAGVGAHRGAKQNVTAPMVQYVNVAEVGMGTEVEKKANFDNPFGTPPPVRSRFFISPSRVSPHIPETPPIHLVNLSPILTRTNPCSAPDTAAKTVSGGTLGSTVHSMASQQSQWRNDGNAKDLKAPPPAHVHFRHNSPMPAPGFFSPNMAVHTRDPMRKTKQPPSVNVHQSLTSNPSRTSIDQSVYDKVTSPRTPSQSPALPYLAPSPVSEQSVVLPYLASPASSIKGQKQAMGPVIVIEAASPTINSESEYGETDAEDDAAELSPEEVKPEQRNIGGEPVQARRTGLVGSPQGFVAPSPTFSSISAYSMSGTETSASSSLSTLSPHESSASSSLSLSASRSDDSSVTVRVTRPGQGGCRNATRTTASLSWLPKDYDELEREGIRGLAS